MTQIKVYRAFREVRKSRNENSLSLLENFHARKGFPLPPQFRSREIRGRKTRTSGKTAREYPASTRNILSVADPRKHHPRGRSAKNSAKLESAEADPIRGGWTRRGWGGGGEEESRGCFPPVVSLARIQRKSNDRLHDRFCQADNRLVAELIYTCTGRKSGIWFTAKIPSDKGAAGERVQPGRDDKFIRLQCSCTTTPPSFPSPDRFLFSHYARTKLVAVHRTIFKGWDLVSIDLEQFWKRGFDFVRSNYLFRSFDFVWMYYTSRGEMRSFVGHNGGWISEVDDENLKLNESVVLVN